MAPTSAIHPDPVPSYIDRIQDFVSENRRAILIATAAALVAAGAVYYASSSRPSSGKGKSKDRKSKKKSVNDPDGPIIEEVKSKDQDSDGVSHRFPPLTSLTVHPTENEPLSAEQIAALPFEVHSFPPHRATCGSLVSLTGTRKTGCVPQDTG